MADPVAEFDPLQELATAHLKRMQEIADESFDKAKTACGDVLDRLKRNVGLRDAVLEKTLLNLGVTKPGETESVPTEPTMNAKE
jgi:hypothetical protein